MARRNSVCRPLVRPGIDGRIIFLAQVGLREVRPDIVLMDVRMPVLLKAIRGRLGGQGGEHASTAARQGMSLAHKHHERRGVRFLDARKAGVSVAC